MYVPKHFQTDDFSAIKEVMHQNDFALVVSLDQATPIATHITHTRIVRSLSPISMDTRSGHQLRGFEDCSTIRPTGHFAIRGGSPP